MHSPLDRISRSLSLLRPLSLLAMLVVLCSLPSRAADVFVDCTGGTPGAFTTLQSAIDSLDFVGPHSITMIAGPCIENVLILDRQRITFQRQTTGFGVAVISPDPGANAVRVFDSTGIVFIEVGFDDSFNGLVVDRNSEVQAFGCTISGNSNAGLIVRGNSTVLVSSALIQSNAGIGINVVAGGSLSMDSDVLIANNGTGVNVVNGSNVRIFAPVSISNNTIGMTAGEASNIRLFGDPAGPTPVSVNGNTSIGVNTFGGHVTMFGPVQVRNNGAGGGSFHAGVRSDDNALVVVAAAVTSTSATIPAPALRPPTEAPSTLRAPPSTTTPKMACAFSATLRLRSTRRTPTPSATTVGTPSCATTLPTSSAIVPDSATCCARFPSSKDAPRGHGWVPGCKTKNPHPTSVPASTNLDCSRVASLTASPRGGWATCSGYLWPQFRYA